VSGGESEAKKALFSAVVSKCVTEYNQGKDTRLLRGSIYRHSHTATFFAPYLDVEYDLAVVHQVQNRIWRVSRNEPGHVTFKCRVPHCKARVTVSFWTTWFNPRIDRSTCVPHSCSPDKKQALFHPMYNRLLSDSQTYSLLQSAMKDQDLKAKLVKGVKHYRCYDAQCAFELKTSFDCCDEDRVHIDSCVLQHTCPDISNRRNSAVDANYRTYRKLFYAHVDQTRLYDKWQISTALKKSSSNALEYLIHVVKRSIRSSTRLDSYHTLSVARHVIPGPRPWALYVMTKRQAIVAFMVSLKVSAHEWKRFLKYAIVSGGVRPDRFHTRYVNNEPEKCCIVGARDDLHFVSAEVAALDGMVWKSRLKLYLEVQHEGANDAELFVSRFQDAFAQLPLDRLCNVLLSSCVYDNYIAIDLPIAI
jgi:hypothetical protein